VSSEAVATASRAPDVNRNPEHDPSCLVDPVVEEDKRMESDSGLDFVVEICQESVAVTR
jgi:hypothetical protein